MVAYFLIFYLLNSGGSKEEISPLDSKFIAFLKATLAKMAGLDVISIDFIDLDFWLSWPRRFYNIRSYDLTKRELENDLDQENNDVADKNSTINSPIPRSETPPKVICSIYYYYFNYLIIYLFNFS